MTESEQLHSTLNGLNEWYKRTFEQAGWVVLAVHKTSSDSSYGEKVNTYKNSIKRLIKHINSRLSNPQGNNTIVRDFPTMIANLTELKSFFDNMESINENVETIGDVAIPDITLYALQNYFKHVFHKLGWMVLTNNKLKARVYSSKPELEQHMQQKLRMYKSCLNILHQSLIERLKTSNDVDKANVEYDLASMIRNIKLLRGCVEAHLTYDNMILSPASETRQSRQSRQSQQTQSVPRLSGLSAAPQLDERVSLGQRLSGLSAVPQVDERVSLAQRLSGLSAVPQVDERVSLAQRLSGLSAAPQLDERVSLAQRLSGLAVDPERVSLGQRLSQSATSDASVTPARANSATSSAMPVSAMPERVSLGQRLSQSATSPYMPEQTIIDSGTSPAMPENIERGPSQRAPSQRALSQRGPSQRAPSQRASQSPQALSPGGLATLVAELTPDQRSASMNISGLRSASSYSQRPSALSRPSQNAPVEINNIVAQVTARQTANQIPNLQVVEPERVSTSFVGEPARGSQSFVGEQPRPSFLEQQQPRPSFLEQQQQRPSFLEQQQRPSFLEQQQPRPSFLEQQQQRPSLLAQPQSSFDLPDSPSVVRTSRGSRAPSGRMVSSKGDVVGERNSGQMLGLTESPNITFTSETATATDAPRGSISFGARTSGPTDTNPLEDIINLVP
jgi:hypothetical protein